MSLHKATCRECGTVWCSFNGDHPEPWDENHEIVWCPACPLDCEQAGKAWHDPDRTLVKDWTKVA